MEIVTVETGFVWTAGGGSTTVVDNLTTASATSALSANQGVVLKGLIDNIEQGGDAVTLDGQEGSFYLSRANHTGTQAPATIAQDANNRFVTDSEKSTWNGKQNALGFTPVATDDARLSDARTPLLHQHSITDVTGLSTALSGKADSSTVTAALADKVDKEAGKGLSSNDFTTEEKNKLAGLEASKFQGTYVSLSALQAADVGGAGHYAYVDEGEGVEVAAYIWDENDSEWVIQKGTSTAETPSSIKTKYESNPDTNAFTDAEKTKLSGLSNYDDTTVTAAISGLQTDKADADSVYTKTEADALLSGKAATVHTHEISQVNGLQSALDAKADSVDVYTKTEVDSAIDLKADAADLVPFTGAALPGDISGYPDGKVFIID